MCYVYYILCNLVVPTYLWNKILFKNKIFSIKKRAIKKKIFFGWKVFSSLGVSHL